MTAILPPVQMHCRRCEVEWAVRLDGTACWLCGLPGARYGLGGRGLKAPEGSTFPEQARVWGRVRGVKVDGMSEQEAS